MSQFYRGNWPGDVLPVSIIKVSSLSIQGTKASSNADRAKKCARDVPAGSGGAASVVSWGETFREASASVPRARGQTGPRWLGPSTGPRAHGPANGPNHGPNHGPTGPWAHGRPRAHGTYAPDHHGGTELMPRTWTCLPHFLNNFCHQELVPWTWTCLKSFLIKLLHTKI